mmetsp:Transcript_14345/g.19639  ORF Transcript_14345/g.19639 Transcript_14345/m.19639 type:complete len:110 (-) Transcript_14345:248-577(-)
MSLKYCIDHDGDPMAHRRDHKMILTDPRHHIIRVEHEKRWAAMAQSMSDSQCLDAKRSSHTFRLGSAPSLMAETKSPNFDSLVYIMYELARSSLFFMIGKSSTHLQLLV